MEPIVIAVRRRGRTSEKILRGIMIGLAVLFLLEGIFFSRGFMLPCAMMALTYYVYRSASVSEYEYTLENDDLSIDRITDRGRRRLHEFPLSCVRVLACPDDPAVAPYRRGGSEKVRKYDYTSYREDVPYYTLIAEQGGEKAKFLLDLTPEAIEYIRHVNREAVRL